MPHSQKVSKIGYSSCFIFNTQNVLEPQKLIDRLFYIELLLSFHINYLQIRGDQLPVTKRSMEPVQFTCEFLSYTIGFKKNVQYISIVYTQSVLSSSLFLSGSRLLTPNIFTLEPRFCLLQQPNLNTVSCFCCWLMCCFLVF